MGKNNSAGILASHGEAGNVTHTVSSRKVSNGYLTNTNTYNDSTGECKSSEMFSKNPPRITPPKVEGMSGRDAAGSEGLAAAKRYLGNDV